MMADFNLRTLANFGAFLPDSAEEPVAMPGDLKTSILSAVSSAITPGTRTAIALSGGVDSACVAAMAKGAINEAWVFNAGGAVPAAKHAAAELGIDLRIVEQAKGGILGTPVADVVAALGHPTHSAAPFAFLQLYRAMAADGVQRVLTGDGADELFAGHAYHRISQPEFAAAKQPEAFWAAYCELRGVAAQVELNSIVKPSHSGRWADWTQSELASVTFAAAMSRTDTADRLRFVDVMLRMGPQCVDLQAALCAFVGIEYAAPLSDRRVVCAALSVPSLLDTERGKSPLRQILTDSLGARWQDVPKDPIASQTGGRASHELPAEWCELLAGAMVEEHGIFDVDAIQARRGALDPTNPWLPRSLVVAATTHAQLGQG